MRCAAVEAERKTRVETRAMDKRGLREFSMFLELGFGGNVVSGLKTEKLIFFFFKIITSQTYHNIPKWTCTKFR